MTKELLLVFILLLGVAGTLLPFLPGIPLMFIALMIYSFFDSWVHFSPLFLLIIGLLTIFIIFIDFFGALWGVKKFGATKRGIWGGLLGSIIGLLFMGPLGLFWGSILGVVCGELLAGKALLPSLKVSIGNLVGFLGTTLLQLAIALIIFFLVIIKLY
ncbi:MAG: hypothetical protein JM58_16330 [Peptococcaceae bacterium BICA1-8]|nr:MAG: hypothetical protein JM58_16330 [Peptococcaceae bacterium BICA1-8]